MLQRLLPVIHALLERKPDAVISVDTRKAPVARAVLEAGADIVNDVSGFTFDPAMAETVAEFDAAAVLMHMRGTPENMRTPEMMRYEDVVEEVADFLENAQAKAIETGIRSDAIMLDPGLGFAKTPEQDFALVRNAAYLRERNSQRTKKQAARSSLKTASSAMFLSCYREALRKAFRLSIAIGTLCTRRISTPAAASAHNMPAVA